MSGSKDIVGEAKRVADELGAMCGEEGSPYRECEEGARLLLSLAAIVERLPSDRNGTRCIPMLDQVRAPSGTVFVVLDGEHAGDVEPFDPVLPVAKCELVSAAAESARGGGA